MDKDVSLIPKGMYCYRENKICPYWSCDVTYEESDWMKMRPISNGKCSFLNTTDNDEPGAGLLWDQVKECGENMGWEEDDDEVITLN